MSPSTGLRLRVLPVFAVVLLLVAGGSLFAQPASSSAGTAKGASVGAAGGANTQPAAAKADSAEHGSPWSLSFAALRTYWFGIVPTGIDLVLDYRGLTLFPGVETIFEDYAGAGYQYNYFYRNPNGSPVVGSDSGTTFSQFEIVDDLGIRQGIVWNPRLQRNLLEGFLLYRFHYDYDYQDPTKNQLIFQSSFPDARQTLINSVVAGFDYNTTVQNKVHGTWNGIYAEASGEWGPRAFFNSIGQANFYRLNFTNWGYKTFYTSSTRRGANLFSLYGAYQVRVDYAGGNQIPIYVMQSFGGRYSHLRYGLGDAVRGFEAGAYDTNFKAAVNFDLRVTGPGIYWPIILKGYLIPGLYAFADGGYYNGYFGDPSNAPGGFLASTGVGAYVDVLGLGNVTAALAFPLVGHRVDNAPYALVFHFHLQM